jgi:hypothetical protein
MPAVQPCCQQVSAVQRCKVLPARTKWSGRRGQWKRTTPGCPERARNLAAGKCPGGTSGPPAGARASNPSAAPPDDSLTPQAGAHKRSQATAPPVDSLAPLARAHANHQGVAPPAGLPSPLTSHSSQESAAIRQLQDQMSTLLSVIYF